VADVKHPSCIDVLEEDEQQFKTWLAAEKESKFLHHANVNVLLSN
jgi:hypothetical protein